MVCHFHFMDPTHRKNFNWEETRRIEAACPDCIAANEAQRLKMQLNETIDPSQPWGEHIKLTCKNHPHLTWTTKNIDRIGCRSIHFSHHLGAGAECPCSINDLVVA